MNTKSKVLVYLLIAILVLQVLPVSAQGETPPPPADVTISDQPSSEDASWPITKKETHKRKDPSTGRDIVETIVVRQKPSGKDNTDCGRNSSGKIDMAVVAATCQFSISIQQTSTVYVGGGAVTSVVTGFADKYCNSANGVCDYVKIKKVQVYWKRTATNFGVINAKSYMGCVGWQCLVCASGVVTTAYLFQSTTFNPSWNGLQTLTYTSTAPTNIPIMMAFVEQGGYPVAGNDSTATAPRSAYSISNYTTFFWP